MQIFAEMILWSENTSSKDWYVPQLKMLFIYFLFMNI